MQLRWFDTEVLGLPIGTIFKSQAIKEEDYLTLEDGTDR
jgi:hypothetical protein